MNTTKTVRTGRERVDCLRSENSKYLPSVCIPDKKVGKYQVVSRTFPPYTEIPVVNMRTAIFSGNPVKNVCYPHEVTYHYLKQKDGSTLMSDIPEEQHDFQEILESCEGNVLVGGLGLGYVAKKLSEKPNVKDIVVVEKNKDIIKLIQPHLDAPNIKVVHDDLFHYLKKNKRDFDSAIFDIWYHDSEAALYEYVVPLRKLAIPHIPAEKIYSWKEDVMRGQLHMNMQTGVAMNYDRIRKMSEKEFKSVFGKWDRPQYAFFNWIRQQNPGRDLAMSQISEYSQTFGDPNWEERWGKYNALQT